MQPDVIQALAAALQPHLQKEARSSYSYPPRYGIKAAGTPSERAYLYEQGGLFGVCDGPAALINAMVGPIGMESALNWYGTDTETEFVDALTDITESGSEQSTACGNCISVSLRACAQLYCFGRFCRQTEELQFDRLGLRANANVPIKTLFGSLTDAAGNVLIGQGEQVTDAFMLQSRAAGYALRLRNSLMLWNGNPANNIGRSYQEYQGFQLIVNTGKFDAYTMQTCEALNSFLMNYGFNAVQSDGTFSITNWFRRMVLQFMRRAEGAGMDWNTAEMFVSMTPNMWDCVARRYACAGIDLCSVSSSAARLNASADEARARYEEYLSRLALPIFGKWYPVKLDAQIPETPGQANGICSDIYFITTAINGEEITFGQYQDFNMTYGKARDELTSLFGSDDIAITDNGRYALIRDNERGCFDVQAYTKPRLVARMPWLLGRIRNVCCDITQEPLPDTTGSGRVYEMDGGRSITPIPTLYGC
ncbi:MAG: hypothetical protein ACREIQ_09340 [Nitrospiria bacterium]